ncbi:MAG: UDP-N-acetylmuramoyl-tripeptide--D-alanyl-D-alanine ligase [Holosporaceae bacterium]|jgi:UDP-N-acetylmuramoyl-tripeptide--D-alanyl-D-alanine ligase|nr:UDP-N-acetylmuramoyl-tripeptide--D-alanyl-D-alanine ligase [Holosporaceae bacterium]
MKELFSPKQLSRIFNQNVKYGASDICINSQDAKPGDMFFALKGENTDGHNFMDAALANGAALVVSEQLRNDERTIWVESSRDALVKLAKYNMSMTKAPCICVTGSVGKTSTRDMIYHLLTSVPKNLKTYVSRKNFNGQIGLPICAATMPIDTDIAVFEIGMSAAGEIKKLLDIVTPAVAVITTICETHLEFFNSVYDIAKAKSEIFEAETPAKAAVIPADSPYADFLKNKAQHCRIKNIFSFGYENKADAKILSYDFMGDVIGVKADILGQQISYNLRCHNISGVSNSAAALLATHLESGIAIDELAESLQTFRTPPGRGDIIYLDNCDIILLDDSYNACPTSLRAAITSMAQKYKNRRKILVVGDMKELGPDSVRFHENISPTVDKFGIDLVLACGELAKCLFDNLREEKKGCWCENSRELTEKVLENLKNGDCVLVKGSNSMKMRCIVDFIKQYHNRIAA